jgi:hypothetical protein
MGLVACSGKDQPSSGSHAEREAAPKVEAPAKVLTLGKITVADLHKTTGFDWLSEPSGCTPMVERGAECESKHEDAFGTGEERHVIHCKVGREEWLLFDSPEVCAEVFETMLANAP